MSRGSDFEAGGIVPPGRHSHEGTGAGSREAEALDTIELDEAPFGKSTAAGGQQHCEQSFFKQHARVEAAEERRVVAAEPSLAKSNDPAIAVKAIQNGRN